MLEGKIWHFHFYNLSNAYSVYVFINTQLRTEKDSHSRAILSFSQINDLKPFQKLHGYDLIYTDTP